MAFVVNEPIERIRLFMTFRGQRSSLVTHWLTVSGDLSSNPGGGEKCSSLIFESQSHDCLKPSNKFMIMQNS